MGSDLWVPLPSNCSPADLVVSANHLRVVNADSVEMLSRALTNLDEAMSNAYAAECCMLPSTREYNAGMARLAWRRLCNCLNTNVDITTGSYDD